MSSLVELLQIVSRVRRRNSKLLVGDRNLVRLRYLGCHFGVLVVYRFIWRFQTLVEYRLDSIK